MVLYSVFLGVGASASETASARVRLARVPSPRTVRPRKQYSPV